MYAKSIIFIEKMLSNQLKNAEAQLAEFRESLRVKYDTGWYDKKMSKAEAQTLTMLRDNRDSLSDALDDFQHHQW